MEIAFLRGQNFTNEKITALADRTITRFERVEAELRDVAVYQASNTAALSCLSGQVGQIQILLGSITKTVIPNSSVCPGWGDVCVRVVPCAAAGTGTTTTTGGK